MFTARRRRSGLKKRERGRSDQIAWQRELDAPFCFYRHFGWRNEPVFGLDKCLLKKEFFYRINCGLDCFRWMKQPVLLAPGEFNSALSATANHYRLPDWPSKMATSNDTVKAFACRSVTCSLVRMQLRKEPFTCMYACKSDARLTFWSARSANWAKWIN